EPASSAASGGAVNEEALSTLAAMGFTPKQAEKALKACDGNVERAVDWLFSHADDPMEEDEPQQGATKPTPAGPQQAPTPALTADPALVAQLASMGFSEAACTRAALAVKNAGPEAAMEWVLTHMEDPDINAPLGMEEAVGMR
ncbi:UBA-like protein, partial [Dunaliella salina]